jgi:hypothetical protein
MTLKALAAEMIGLKQTVQALQTEVRMLRRGRAQADEDAIEALLEHIYDDFGDRPWFSFQIQRLAFDQPVLRGAVVRCVGRKPTVQRLGKFLMRNLGTWGKYHLACVREHTANGAEFRLTECVSASAAGYGSPRTSGDNL